MAETDHGRTTMGLFSSSSSSSNSIFPRGARPSATVTVTKNPASSTTVRYVTVAALGFTALVIAGVVRHSGLVEPHRPPLLGLGPDPTQVHLGAVPRQRFTRAREQQPLDEKRRPHQLHDVQRAAPAADDIHVDDAGAAPKLGQAWRTPFPAFDGESPAVYRYEIVNKFPHDPTAFTQGFLYRLKDGADTFFESTGSVGGPSTVREVDLVTGKVRRRTELDTAYFAEGLTMYGDKLAQITWRNNKGFYYDPATLEKSGEFSTPLKDGWGLTTDASGDVLIVTDASQHLHFVAPAGGTT